MDFPQSAAGPPTAAPAARPAAATGTDAPAPDTVAGLYAALLAQLPPPRPALRAVVIIPAKNEAGHLPGTLRALARQVDLTGRRLAPDSYEIIVLANNCTDGTAAVVRRFGRRRAVPVYVAVLTLPGAEAHVGRARRLLMDAACQRLLAVGRPGGLILSTDADTRVAPNWLAATQAEIAAGADAVGGRILIDPDIDPEPAPARPALRRTQLLDAAYHLLRAQLEHCLDPQPADPWPRHHQHFGASLALTARAYRRVGGLPVVRFLEDEALCQLLRRHDLRLRHSPRVVVHTSPRQCGRVEVGLSWQLREWANLGPGHEPEVEGPAHLADLWRWRRQLRAAWGRTAALPAAAPSYAALALALGVPARELAAQARAALTFGRLWEWVLATRAQAGLLPPRLPLAQAVRQLRELLAA